MAYRGSSAVLLCVAAALSLSSCRPEGGTAEIVNDSGNESLQLVMVDAEGREWLDKPLEDFAYFDTQFPERDLQCYIESDGRFEVREPDGEVFARHDYAARPLCDGDVVVLGPDGSLAWEE